jgi:hypothetical protein
VEEVYDEQNAFGAVAFAVISDDDVATIDTPPDCVAPVFAEPAAGLSPRACA